MQGHTLILPGNLLGTPQALGMPTQGSQRVQAAPGCPHSCTIKQTDTWCNKAAETIITFCQDCKFGHLWIDKCYRFLLAFPLCFHKKNYGGTKAMSFYTRIPFLYTYTYASTHVCLHKHVRIYI